MKKLTKIEKNLYTSLIIIILLVVVISVKYPKATVFSIKESENNFNLEVEISKSHKNVLAGEDIWFTTKILNLAGEKRIDVTLEYNILDPENKSITTKSETVAIETQASFVSNLKIPEDVAKGDYYLYVKLLVNEKQEVESKDSFRVIRKQDNKNFYLIILAIFFMVLILIYLIIKSKKVIEKMKIRSKIRTIIKKKIKRK